MAGVGIAMVAVSAMTSMYYNMILAWAYYYMFASFTSKLPWEDCNNGWNTKGTNNWGAVLLFIPYFYIRKLVFDIRKSIFFILKYFLISKNRIIDLKKSIFW